MTNLTTEWDDLWDKHVLLAGNHAQTPNQWLQLNAEINIALLYAVSELRDQLQELKLEETKEKLVKELEKIAQNTCPD